MIGNIERKNNNPQPTIQHYFPNEIHKMGK
jgi:hypothetical protein